MKSKTITLRIPETLYQQVTKLAEIEDRSINNQIVKLIKTLLNYEDIDVKSV
jgi:hypothetical protein